MKEQLTESIESQVMILEGFDDGYNRAKFLVTTVDVSNRNGRTYPEALALREVSMNFDGRLLGQSTHPNGDPDPLEQFLVFEKAMLEDGFEYFVAKVVPTSKGRDFAELAKAGAMFSVSRRGSGELVKGKDKNGKETMVVKPESYTLQGIDVLYPNTQSDWNGNMIHFEALDNDMELTVEKLRSEYAELVSEIEKPFETEKAVLEERVAELEAKVAELSESGTRLTEQVEALTESNKKETWLREAAEARATELEETGKAFTYLLDKVKGEKSAWLILDELKNSKTVAEVDANYENAKRRCDALIENFGTAGRAVFENEDKPAPNIINKDKTLEKSRLLGGLGLR